MFKCSKCDRQYEHTRSLHRHIKKCHPSDASKLVQNKIKSKGEGQHVCNLCSKRFADTSGVRKHQRKLHQLFPSKVNMNCCICDFTSTTDKSIIKHIKEVHDIDLTFEEKRFTSFTDFRAWKESVESQTNSSFIRRTAVKRRVDGTRLHSYHCHRSGTYVSKSTGKRHLKTQGSCKLNGFCPASMKMVLLEDGTCRVTFVTTHVGHKGDLGHLRLKQQEREQIASKIAAHIPMDNILDEVRNSIVEELDRIHLITKKDLHNIEQSFNLNSDVMRHQDDGTSVSAWVKEMEETGNKCVLLYKPPGEEYPGLKKDDFALMIMNDAQRSMLDKYGSDCVCMDGTHGLNSYGYELITLLVLDDLRQGFPCAFLISNRSDQTVLSIFLELVRNETHIISPNVFMSDMAEAFYNAWCAIMNAPNKRLFCTWHVDRAWRKNLSKVPKKEKQVEVYKLIRTIMEERETASFILMLDAGVKMLCQDSDTSEFGHYFRDSYAPCKEMWAYCYRVHCGLNTNMHLEAMHKTIKYVYLHGKSVKRLDKSIHAIMTFVRDKVIDRLVIIHKGKITSKIADLRKRHKASTTMSEELVVENAHNSWDVMSSSAQEMYRVEKILESCDCKIVCDECNACIHKYRCSCPDSAIKWSMCKHIHLVCRLKNHEQEEYRENDVTESLVMDTDGPREIEAHALTDTLKQPESASVSLQIKKQQLLQSLCQIIQETETEEEIKAVEKHMAPINAILTAIRQKKRNIENFIVSTSAGPANKNINSQRLFKMKKSRKTSIKTISRPTSQEAENIAANLVLQVRVENDEEYN